MLKPTPKVGTPLFRAAAEVNKATDKPRSIRFVASDESVDRYGDVIRVDGWDLTAYKGNPVLLFGHNSREPPIGTAEVWVEGKQLLADATFAPESKSQFADEIWNLVDADILRAVSVGFLPTIAPKLIMSEPDEEDGSQHVTGFEFIGQELLELSVVPVPANPAALALARSLAIREATTRRLFIDDARASAHVAAAHRRRSINLARLRAG